MSQSNAGSSNYPGIARALTWRYVIALALVASLSTAAWISLHLVISEQKSTAAIVNVSGRQRMLSQRTALYSNLLISTPVSARPLIRGKLKEAIDLMARSHRGLIHGDSEMGLPDTMSATVRAMYFEGSNGLDRQVEAYLEAVNALLLLDDHALTPENPHLQYITRTAPATVVAALDRMVLQYQLEGEASIRRLQNVETAFWLVTLLLLTLEALLIFHPFVMHIRAVTAELETATELTKAHAEVRRQKGYLQAIFETEPECVKVIAPDGSLVDMNPAGLGMLEVDTVDEAKATGLLPFIDQGYRDAFVSLSERVLQGGSGVLQFPITGKKGTRRWLESHAAPLRDENGAVTSVLAVTRDITDRKASEDTIRHMAFYDRLTNLPNRRLLDDRLDQGIVRARRERHSISLLFVDLDMFKEVNDDMGHEAGDWLLKRVAERMQQCLRASDTAARIGGDEFIVLLPDSHLAQDAASVAEKIRAALAEPFPWRADSNINISCSVGVVMYPEHADNARDLLRFGDEAMYRAKKGGRNAVHVFAPTVTGAGEERAIVRLIWKPAYWCGEQNIDREHEELFRLANVLLDAALERDTKPDQFGIAFDALLSHVTAHFSHEEEILRAHRYDGLDEHARLHQQLVQHALALRTQSDEPGFQTGELIDFLVSEVVAGHMLKEDKKFFPLFARSE